jgi:hypothetical protein
MKPQRLSVALSLLLFFFIIPHILEDFALGEPAKAGIPAPHLSFVISGIIFLQALALYWLGQARRQGHVANIVVGLFWAFNAGSAQLPAIFTGAPFRSGAISILYVLGLVSVGLLLGVSSGLALKRSA